MVLHHGSFAFSYTQDYSEYNTKFNTKGYSTYINLFTKQFALYMKQNYNQLEILFKI